MKQFKWEDAPKGTTHRCTYSDTWIRTTSEVNSFWNIGSEQWEATNPSNFRSQWLMKKPLVADIDWTKAPEGYDYHIESLERHESHFYKKSVGRYIQPNGLYLNFVDAIEYKYKITTRPGPFTKVELSSAYGRFAPTEMMLTRPVLFFGTKEGTQMIFPSRTLVTIVGQVSTGLVLYHRSTMRHAVVNKSAVKPVMSEEDELVEEACAVVGEYCDDVTVEKLIKAGYRKTDTE